MLTFEGATNSECFVTNVREGSLPSGKLHDVVVMGNLSRQSRPRNRKMQRFGLHAELYTSIAMFAVGAQVKG